MKRGILYLTWGKETKRFSNALNRSIESAKKFGIEYKVCEGKDYSSKCDIYKHSPFDTTLFLDIDTVILGDLTHGFDSAEKYGISISLSPQYLLNLHWQMSKHCPQFKDLSNDLLDYNVGAIFFTKSKEVISFMKDWKNYSSIISENMELCDQNSFSIACWESGFNPYVLPSNWNFRPRHNNGKGVLFGPIKIWHSYGPVPNWILNHNKKKNRWGE